MNEAVKWLMMELILLNLMAFCFGAIFGINLQRLQDRLEKESLEDDKNS